MRTSNPSSLRLTGKPLYQFILQDLLNVKEKPTFAKDEMLKSLYTREKPLFVIKKSLYDELIKAFRDRSKLVPKQIQARSKKARFTQKSCM